MTTEHEMHMNWIRLGCFEEAAKTMPGGGVVEDILVEAKKIEQYVSGRNPKNVVKLAKGRGKR